MVARSWGGEVVVFVEEFLWKIESNLLIWVYDKSGYKKRENKETETEK